METDNPVTDSVAEPRADETSDAPSQFAALTSERDRLATEKAELHELLLRRQAEFDNFRRRSERERADLLEYASMDTVKALLPVVDDFERAMKMSASSEADAASKELFKGVELIYNRLMEALKKTGLEPISAKGHPFDPHRHEAIERVPTEEAEDETVLDEYQRGYFFRGKLLRPAMVKVAVKP